MFRDIVAIGRDVDRRGSRHIGSILIGRMTIAGQLTPPRLRTAPQRRMLSTPSQLGLRSLNDPLRNATYGGALDRARCPPATRWRSRRRRSSSSPSFPARAATSGPAQVEALLKIDARLEPIIAQLTQQYTTNYQKSTERRVAAVARGVRSREGVHRRLPAPR